MPASALLTLLLMSPQSSPATARPAAAPPTLVARAPDALPKSRVRAPVLNQGTYLAGVRGYFAHSIAEPGLLVFVLDEGFLSNVRRTLLVMPSDPSDDVKAILADITPDTPSVFQVSGRVYEYKGRAYLLPISVVALRNDPPPEMLARIAPPGLARAEDLRPAARPPRIDAYADLDAQALDATPARDVPADRMAHEPDPTLFPGLDDGFADRIERDLEKGIAASKTGTALHPAIADGDRSALLPTGTRLQGRRANIVRDPVTGAWRARLDAARPGEGAHDGAEVSMELLPTRELERLERTARQQPVGTPWLVSGEVVVSRDRSFLLLDRAVPMAAERFLSP